MEAEIDYAAVLHQVQLENEMLRSHLKTYTDLHDSLLKFYMPFVELWHKATANKTQLLIILMLIYWCVSIGFMVWDRL